jgi:hypothetical protein
LLSYVWMITSSTKPAKPDNAAAAPQTPSLSVRVPAPDQWAAFDRQLAAQHYLGAGRPVGDYLRQIVERDGRPVALLVWGPACYALKDRDLWISWSVPQRVERLKLIVQNRRFLLLTPKGAAPNLASQSLAAAVRALPEQWRQHFGHRPLLAESFTDPEAHAGTCYKASNWEAVGMSAGYSRHRADFYVPNDRPKKLWLYPLCPDAKALLRSARLPEEFRPALIAAPAGTLPVKVEQMDSLLDVFRRAPDPRERNTRYRIGPVLTIIAMALMAGRREIAEIARFATTLTQPLRRRLNLPLKHGTKRFHQVPAYDVFYQVLTRMDSEAFATRLTEWLQQQHGQLPAALALDGKMIRDHIGLLTLAQHEDGAPQALAVFDQKENTPRCEQTAAVALLETLPALDGKIVTADPLHCQRKTARVIVEKGGDYLFQIKGNQPKLLEQARTFDALKDTPFLNTAKAVTDGSTPGDCTTLIWKR